MYSVVNCPWVSVQYQKKKKNERARKNRKNKADDAMIVIQEMCTGKDSRGSKMFIRIKKWLVHVGSVEMGF